MKYILFCSAASLCLGSVTSLLFAGAAIPGDGGVQIYFSDDGMGGTAVTATGSGRTDDDDNAPPNAGNSQLGFSESIEVDSLEPSVPSALAALADIAKVDMTDPIEFTWTGVRTVTYDRFEIDIADRSAVVFESTFGNINVPAGGADMEVSDGDGTIPLPYSTFASVHGQSFPTTDGFTFVFEGTAPGNSGLQILFSDGGNGTTNITASGFGVTDDDANLTRDALGFSTDTDADLIADAAILPAVLPELLLVSLTDPITLRLPATVDLVIDEFTSSETFFGLMTSESFDPVTGPSHELSVLDGTGSMPVDFSTFADFYGMSFPSADGYTFVFSNPVVPAAAQALAVCDKSQLLRKIKKLKKKLKKAKRAGNTTKAKKLKKKLKKLKKKFKSLC